MPLTLVPPRTIAPPRCAYCGGPAPYLCDYPLARHSAWLCDAALCGHCTTRASGMDLCPAHTPFVEGA
jgi:hypothetical protein